MQRILDKQRDQAATSRREDVAKRPASFKSAISLSLPVGTTRKKDRHRESSPERQHVYVNNPAVVQKESKSGGFARDEEAYERMKQIKQKYGDVSALSTQQASSKPASNTE